MMARHSQLSAGERNNLRDFVDCIKTDIEGYDIIKKIGEGGSRKVYLADKHGLRQNVVLKRFKREGVHERIEQKRKRETIEKILQRELEMLRNLQHPNIVRQYHHAIPASDYMRIGVRCKFY